MLAGPGQPDTGADAILLGHRGESQHTYIIIHHFNVEKSEMKFTFLMTRALVVRILGWT